MGRSADRPGRDVHAEEQGSEEHDDDIIRKLSAEEKAALLKYSMAHPVTEEVVMEEVTDSEGEEDKRWDCETILCAAPSVARHVVLTRRSHAVELGQPSPLAAGVSAVPAHPHRCAGVCTC